MRQREPTRGQPPAEQRWNDIDCHKQEGRRQRDSPSFDVDEDEDEKNAITAPYTFKVVESMARVRGDWLQTEVGPYVVRSRPQASCKRGLKFARPSGSSARDTPHNGGRWETEPTTTMNFESERPLKSRSPRAAAKPVQAKQIFIYIDNRKGETVPETKPKVVLTPKRPREIKPNPSIIQRTLFAKRASAPGYEERNSFPRSPAGPLEQTPVEQMVIRESAEDSMLHDYWAMKEELEDKYKKLFDDLKKEEEIEIHMKMSKLTGSKQYSAGEAMEILASVKEDYEQTRLLLQEQKIVEQEQILSEYKGIIL